MKRTINYSNPKVSVIISTYNRANLVTRAIDSVLNQTHKNFEIVIVDSSTCDNTKRTLEPYLKTGKIKYVYQKPKGLAAARNFGVKNISKDSKYVAFLDDDDEWLPQFLEKILKEFEYDENLSVISAGAKLKTQAGKKIGKFLKPIAKFWRQPVGANWILKKEIFTKENIWFDEKMIAEDLDFGIRVLKNHRAKIIPEILWTYYAFPEDVAKSLSTKFSWKAKGIEHFYKKNQGIYFNAGKEAWGFLNFFVGKTYCQAGKIKKGRFHLKEALMGDPKIKYFFYYLATLLFPKVFQGYRILILKHKIFRS
ncbi:MAG: glycosyltransferase family 2 protein [Promethearchaeota archaeon]